ncbi:MAG: hypothetical protein DYG98_21955 [Haliscomenobacteraceae bacterium CHB4]|nr:hypothetical protein [Haliscomenobacteraceae bacterium CHB4]
MNKPPALPLALPVDGFEADGAGRRKVRVAHIVLASYVHSFGTKPFNNILEHPGIPLREFIFVPCQESNHFILSRRFF